MFAAAAAAEPLSMSESVYRGGGGRKTRAVLLPWRRDRRAKSSRETKENRKRTPGNIPRKYSDNMKNIVNTEGMQEASQEKTRKNQKHNKYKPKEDHGKKRVARAKQNNMNANLERQLDQKTPHESNQSHRKSVKLSMNFKILRNLSKYERKSSREGPD